MWLSSRRPAVDRSFQAPITHHADHINLLAYNLIMLAKKKYAVCHAGHFLQFAAKLMEKIGMEVIDII